MILIKNIQIEEFRGIRNLKLDIDGKNFGICGPNGSGKSGVVDAIEFCLTGNVTRLSGEGTSGISVKKHAPHIDQQIHPEKAIVIIEATIPSSGKTIRIKRSVKDSTRVQIDPIDLDVKSIVEKLEKHPEFTLSRRDISKYIITSPNKRSVDVQILLRLDHLEKLRKSLTTFSNKCNEKLEFSKNNFSHAKTELKNSLGIEKLDKALFLKNVNDLRKVLGLQVLTELTEKSSFKQVVTFKKKSSLNKSIALSDLLNIQTLFKDEEPSSLTKSKNITIKTLEKLMNENYVLELARQHSFIKIGIEFITSDACPLCGKAWNENELRKYLKKKLLSSEQIKKLLDQLHSEISSIQNSIFEFIKATEKAIQYCKMLKPPIPLTELTALEVRLNKTDTALKNFLTDYNLIQPAIKYLKEEWWWGLINPVKKRLNECIKAVNSLPDTSKEENARETLIIVQERYERYSQIKKNLEIIRSRYNISKKILEYYNETITTVLESIYNKVEKDFANYYRKINNEDEENFIGKLTSKSSKLKFDVDFYGRGLFPPSAYHSEGHQDGMGLCLYLALMKHTLKEKFTFAVLDDVLMSIDTGHRRSVCRLLKSEFPRTQFIITTHDKVWLRYMKTEGLIENSQIFGGWTVDIGPRIWNNNDIWDEIDSELEKDNIEKSAWLLRNYLEYIATILADNLRVKIEYKSNGNYNLGDLFPNILKQWKKLLEQGENSAKKWNRIKESKDITEMRKEAKDLIAKSNVEQWAINPNVHFNKWANFNRKEFKDIVNIFKELLDNIRCKNLSCKSFLYIQPKRGKVEEIRCNCGATIINLKT